MDIYVGNLPYAATDKELRELFESYGTVTSARVIIDKFSGQSKGFGFVEIPDREEAMKAIEAINGSDFTLVSGPGTPVFKFWLSD